ncbi:MAG: transglycosylase SLT domain-containing protein [Chloroflexi bacterium]|nr:transglycosylase SLT domain-containing protein [Chloroflexota bacterium]
MKRKFAEEVGSPSVAASPSPRGRGGRRPSPRLYFSAIALSVGLASAVLISSLAGTWKAPAARAPVAATTIAEQAWKSRLEGAYEQAARGYLEARSVSGAEGRSSLALAAAEAYLTAQDYTRALEAARLALADDPRAVDARIVEGRALMGAGRLDEAERALQAHLDGDRLAGYGAFLSGELRSARGDLAGAGARYAQAVELGLAPLWEVAALRGVARGLEARGDAAGAAVTYERAAARGTQIEDAGVAVWFDGELVRRSAEARVPNLLWHAAQAYRTAGEVARAVDTYLAITSDYPSAREAEAALEELVDLGVADTLDPISRGRILLQAGKPTEADAAFAAVPFGTPQRPEAAYHAGLALRDQGLPFDAIEQLTAVASRYSGSSLAPEALWQVARLTEQWLGADLAREAYFAVANTFPHSPRVAQALMEAAAIASDAGEVATATSIWRRITVEVADPSARAEAQYRWGHSLLVSGEVDVGMALLAGLEETAPTSFAGLRARDVRLGGLGAEPYRAAATASLAGIVADDAQTCSDWIVAWSGRPVDPAPAALLTRVDRLTAGGLPGPAQAEILGAIPALTAGQLDGLARALTERALHPVSILLANRLAALSPARHVDSSPACLQRLVYPLAFPDLVQRQAAANGLDPYLLLSLLRQESWFGAGARSAAPAYGLSQVTPSTAADIARGLGRSGFRIEDLNRPNVSVEFGSWYLAQQQRELGGRPMLALAAYNAGPGSVLRWVDGNLNLDPDRFVDAIDYAETRTYVRSIYETYGHYRALYG